MNKSVLLLSIYLSKINEKIHVGIDGNLSDIETFGMSTEQIKKISDLIENELNKKIETAPEILDQLTRY